MGQAIKQLITCNITATSQYEKQIICTCKSDKAASMSSLSPAVAGCGLLCGEVDNNFT